MNDETLCHYGILGMRWGKRKDKIRSQKGSNGNSIKGKIVKEYSNKKAKKVNIKKLSNEDLQAKIRRLEMEKRYRDLKRDEVSSGRKLVGEILNTSAKRVGISALTTAGSLAISSATGLDIKPGKKKK